MKKILKKIIPEKFIKKYRSFIVKRKLKKLYSRDFARYFKYSCESNVEVSYDNLRSLITFYYHALEKGLSNRDMRAGFGKTAIEGLIDTLNLYVDKSYPLDDVRYLTGISVLKRYIEIHKSLNFDVSHLEKKVNLYPLQPNKVMGGEKELLRDELLSHSENNFEELVMNRHSVRDFSEKPVDRELVYDAISIAAHTPSACNRQSSRVYFIKDKKLVHEILNCQHGLRGFGQNIDSLLIVTSDNQYFISPHERNQTFIDGGMFAMTLLYALYYKGIATCPLNSSLSVIDEEKIRNIANISPSENIIEFVAIGNYPDKVKVAISNRDSQKLITIEL